VELLAAREASRHGGSRQDLPLHVRIGRQMLSHVGPFTAPRHGTMTVEQVAGGRAWLRSLHAALPTGRTLGNEEWQRRHRAILVLLWIHVPAIALFALYRGFEPSHAIAEAAIVAAAGAVALMPRWANRVRATAASFGLLSSSAILVHISGGYIEMHFHFFVMIPIIALYEDWVPFILAASYVLVHHGVAGAFDPGSVYNHPDALLHPWRWAAIHAFFIAGISGASVYYWKLNEQAREKVRQMAPAAARLAAIVASSDDAIVSKDLNGTVTSWNRGAEAMFGYVAEEAIGRPLAELIIPSELAAEETEILRRVAAGERVDHFETERRRKDGSTVEVSVTISPVRDASGRIVGASKVARDITERRRSEAALKAANARLEELSHLKNQFLNMIAHELRNPMTPIMLQLQLLRMGQLPTQARTVDLLERSMGRLNLLVQQLNDVARLETGRLQLQKEPIDLVEVVREAVENHVLAAQEQGVALEFAGGDRFMVDSDPQRLMQVIVNLLTNAIKFTPKGGRVFVRAARSGGEALVSVEDTGLGLTADQRQRLFQPFSQVHQIAKSGSGLGLYISKSIIEANGGRIWVESPGPARGAVFTFALPLRLAEVEGVAIPSTAARELLPR
jgi:PAS domain S-box-containing protein